MEIFLFILGEASEHRLKQLVNYDYWNIWQDPKLKTELKENGCIFQYGTVTYKFIADSRKFSDQYRIW
ncbi:9815_t:CDS:2, partial [Gigaspora rosea]